MSADVGISPAAHRIDRRQIHHRKAALERLLLIVFVAAKFCGLYRAEAVSNHFCIRIPIRVRIGFFIYKPLDSLFCYILLYRGDARFTYGWSCGHRCNIYVLR